LDTTHLNAVYDPFDDGTHEDAPSGATTFTAYHFLKREDPKLGELLKCVDGSKFGQTNFVKGNIYHVVVNPRYDELSEFDTRFAILDEYGVPCNDGSLALFERVSYEDAREATEQQEEDDLAFESLLEDYETGDTFEVGQYVTWGAKAQAYRVLDITEEGLKLDNTDGFTLIGGEFVSGCKGDTFVDFGSQPVVYEPTWEDLKSRLPEADLDYNPNPPSETLSDGGATSYYDLPDGATTLNDLIEDREMSFALGNVFKAAYRIGRKPSVTDDYDLRKIIYFAQRELDARARRRI
jgi:hypothetical protein